MSMSSTSVVFILAGAFFLLSACQRPASETTRISLEIPTYEKAGNNGALSCSPCLKEILINIDGDKFETIRYQDSVNIHSEGEQVKNTSVELEVPIGPQRRIQMLALYRNDDNAENAHISVHYKEKTIDLNTTETRVEMNLEKLGDVGGAIVGRYLTGTNPDTGPSGRVRIEFVHPTSGLKISLLHGEIINGWFNFIAANSTNLRLTYKMADTGEVLFGGEPLSTDYIKNNKTSPSVLHITRPQTYYVSGDGSTRVMHHAGDLVYGFFGSNPAVTTLTGKHVCVEPTASAPVSLDKTYTDSATTVRATYSASTDPTLNNSGNFKPTGGSFEFFDAGLATYVCSSPQFTTKAFGHNQIQFRRAQIDGRGDDHARSIEGAFTYSFADYDAAYAGYILKKYQRITPFEYAVRPLPDLASSDESMRYNGGRIFKRNLAAAEADIKGGIICSEKWMSDHNFIEVPVETGGLLEGPALNASNDFTFVFDNGAISDTDAVVICPSKVTSPSADKVMDGLGAMMLGDLRTAELEITSTTGGASFYTSGDITIVDYGMATTGSSNDTTLTLQNNGNVSITGVTGVAVASGDFSLGNGNIFPGTVSGSACGGAVGASQNCEVTFIFTPQATGTRYEYYEIQYSVSGQASGKTLRLKLQGTGN